jgi:hypothetical protein
LESEIAIKPGQLVRYLPSLRRWYFAKVQRVYSDGVRIAFFDDDPPKRATWDQIQTMDDFLNERNRVWSRTRLQLTDHFFGRELTHLRETRIKTMKQALRTAGISFTPAVWPAGGTRIRFWRDTSVVRPARRDNALLNLLPQWVDPFVLPSASRDPLGLQAPAERLVNEVLPGLTVFTSRAGYYGFLSWAIDQVNSKPDNSFSTSWTRRDLLNAMERALALSEFVFHGRDGDDCRIIGQRSKTRVLQSARGDRYSVPSAILKNQNSAGALRLYTTSLISLGLVEDDPTLAVEEKLPFRLTQRGKDLARAFGSAIDSEFIPFAFGSKTIFRDVVKQWGAKLCFSSIARRAQYKSLMVKALFRGNSLDAEKRFRTATLLFEADLMLRPQGAKLPEVIAEDEAYTDAELAVDGVTNLDVILHFYGLRAKAELLSLQAMAVFELLSLALSALFGSIVDALSTSTNVNISGLARSVCGATAMLNVADVPMNEARPRTVRQLVTDLMTASADGASNASAGIGGALFVRVLRDPLLPSVWGRLSDTAGEIMSIVESAQSRMDHPFSEVLPGLFAAMVERHAVVSARKNRQRWLLLDGENVIKDDLQAMGLGLHALRFPQLASLVNDLGMSREDLIDG